MKCDQQVINKWIIEIAKKLTGNSESRYSGLKLETAKPTLPIRYAER